MPSVACVVEVLVGLGAAPGLATREHFARPDGIPGKGVEPAAVPGAFDAVLTALRRAPGPIEQPNSKLEQSL